MLSDSKVIKLTTAHYSHTTKHVMDCNNKKLDDLFWHDQTKNVSKFQIHHTAHYTANKKCPICQTHIIRKQYMVNRAVGLAQHITDIY